MHTPTTSLTTMPARTLRRDLTRALALMVAAALAVVLPAQQTDASSLQELTVRTTGIPTGTEIGLLRLDRTGSYFGWQESAATDATGTVTFATLPDQTYTLWAAETDLTFPQYLGGATAVDGATRFTTPSAAEGVRNFDATAAPLLRGTVAWPAGTAYLYGEVLVHTWDAAAHTWRIVSYGPVAATGGEFAVKAPPGIPVTLSATLERADGSASAAWLGGGAAAPQDLASATTVTAATGAPVTGIRLTVPSVAMPDAAPPATTTSPPPTDPQPGVTPTAAPPALAAPTTKSHEPAAPSPVLNGAVRLTPRISGTARVGKRLTASRAPQGWTATYRWKRDGQTIARATGRTYRPTSKDAGRRLTVTMTARRAGHPATSATARAVRVTKIASTVRLVAAKRAIRITVRASRVKAPTGKLTVRVGSRTRSYTLRAGHRGTLTVKAPKGRAQVRVTYRGDGQVAKTSASTALRIR